MEVDGPWVLPSLRLWRERETTAFLDTIERSWCSRNVLSNGILCFLQERCSSHSHVFFAGPVNRIVDGRIIFKERTR